MSKQQELAERIDGVKELLEKGVQPGEITKSLCAKWGIGARTVDRYIAHAKDIIHGQLKRQEAIIQELRSEIINDELRNSILSSLELEARLCAIIEGKLLAEKLVRNKEGNVERLTCLPSHRDIIYAIDKLFRKRGGYDKVARENEAPVPIYKIVVANRETANSIQKISNGKCEIIDENEPSENPGEDQLKDE